MFAAHIELLVKRGDTQVAVRLLDALGRDAHELRHCLAVSPLCAEERLEHLEPIRDRRRGQRPLAQRIAARLDERVEIDDPIHRLGDPTP